MLFMTASHMCLAPICTHVWEQGLDMIPALISLFSGTMTRNLSPLLAPHHHRYHHYMLLFSSSLASNNTAPSRTHLEQWVIMGDLLVQTYLRIWCRPGLSAVLMLVSRSSRDEPHGYPIRFWIRVIVVGERGLIPVCCVQPGRRSWTHH